LQPGLGLVDDAGNSDFAGLHSRKHDQVVQFYAFDMLAGGGDDYRRLPLSLRKTSPSSSRAARRWHPRRPLRAR